MKSVIFHPAAREMIRSFSKEVRIELGSAIQLLQMGESLSMPLAKPMSSVASGVYELRIKDASGAYRVFYATKYTNAVLIFHAFIKKTQKTTGREIETGKRRLKELLGSLE